MFHLKKKNKDLDKEKYLRFPEIIYTIHRLKNHQFKAMFDILTLILDWIIIKQSVTSWLLRPVEFSIETYEIETYKLWTKDLWSHVQSIYEITIQILNSVILEFIPGEVNLKNPQ